MSVELGGDVGLVETRSVCAQRIPIRSALRWLLFLFRHLSYISGTALAENVEAHMHGQPATSIMDYLSSAQFWFEPLQNWQSEFLSTAVVVVLSIFL